MTWSKNLKIGLGAFAAVAVIGSGIGVAAATNGDGTDTSSQPAATSSTAPSAGASAPTGGQAPTDGQAPADGQAPPDMGNGEPPTGGGPGGGGDFLAEELATALNLDQETVATALQEAQSELASSDSSSSSTEGGPGRGPMDMTALAPLLAEKLDVSESDVLAALQDMQPPAMDQGTAPSAMPTPTS